MKKRIARKVLSEKSKACVGFKDANREAWPFITIKPTVNRKGESQT